VELAHVGHADATRQGTALDAEAAPARCGAAVGRSFAGTLRPNAKAGSSMATSKFKLDTPRVQTDIRAGFGRGSAVREYWLERCQGFSAVRTDGRPLGRVRRVETRIEGTFLRLTGIWRREVPVSAIDTVWPSASVLTISAEEADADRPKVAGEVEHRERPAWEDETLPWWELFADGVHSMDSSTAPSGWSRFLSIVPSGRSLVELIFDAVAACVRQLVERSRTLIRALRVKAVRSSGYARQAARSASTRASRGIRNATQRSRRTFARKLFKVVIWIAGSRETILDPDSERQRSVVDDEETAEIT
jgi:hypothetical protein